jgi:hypothetical protein
MKAEKYVFFTRSYKRSTTFELPPSCISGSHVTEYIIQIDHVTSSSLHISHWLALSLHSLPQIPFYFSPFPLILFHFQRTMSAARQNYHETTEAEMNKMINMELTASYLYICMGSHFDRDDVALPNLSSYFRECSDGKRTKATEVRTACQFMGGNSILGNWGWL